MEQQHEAKHQPIDGLLLESTAKYVSVLNVIDFRVKRLRCLVFFLLYELFSVRRVLHCTARIYHLEGWMFQDDRTIVVLV